jgi:hypothetical protein
MLPYPDSTTRKPSGRLSTFVSKELPSSESAAVPVFLHRGHLRTSTQWSSVAIREICAYGAPDQAKFRWAYFTRPVARIEAAAPFPRIGVIADALGNRPDMNIAEIYMQQLWRWSADWRVSSGVGIHSSGWRVSGATLWPRSRIPVSSTTRVKSAIVLLMVDSGSGSLDCPMILGRFRPVRMVRKRDAMPHQSAPCAGRQIAP